MLAVGITDGPATVYGLFYISYRSPRGRILCTPPVASFKTGVSYFCVYWFVLIGLCCCCTLAGVAGGNEGRPVASVGAVLHSGAGEKPRVSGHRGPRGPSVGRGREGWGPPRMSANRWKLGCSNGQNRRALLLSSG